MAVKKKHEFRDPVHGFIFCTPQERKVIDSRPFQRLRNIHQLAMTYLVYPGATHRRFEHCLGVMELATQVFRVITDLDNLRHLPDSVLESLPELQENNMEYWERTLRMAALCHDLGHLPFSHGAEDLLPVNYSHERISWDIIHSDEMAALFKEMHLDPQTIAKIAVGAKDLQFADISFSMWETLLSEIIVGDAFGVDRMDYLLRDSLHLGVTYGHFDITRLIPALRIVYKPAYGEDGGESFEASIGVERGALQAAGSLVWARYSIFSQVYFHPVRRVYDIHLRDFVAACYPDRYPIELSEFLALSDNNILLELEQASSDRNHPNHLLATRITQRQHFQKVYHLSYADKSKNIEAVKKLYAAINEEFPGDSGLIRMDTGSKKNRFIDFPVLDDLDSSRMLLASEELPSINQVPDVESGYLFADRTIRNKIITFLKDSKDSILSA